MYTVPTHVVPALEISHQFVDQVARNVADDVRETVIRKREGTHGFGWPIPEVMMWIDDRQVWVENLFRHLQINVYYESLSRLL